MDTAAVSAVRSFNRIVTERVGALDEQYLGTGRSLGQARMLWEIGFDGADVRDLRRRLGLDSGHASRLLRALERQGLVEMGPSPADGRVRRARLTAAGKRERRELDRLSNDLAKSMLEPLDETQRMRLQTAMAEVERLLRASLIEIEIADPASDDVRFCVDRYFGELAERFKGGFDRTQTLQIVPADLTPPNGLVLVARLRGRPVGCGSLLFDGRKPAYVKRMWISPDVRGAGLGRRLLLELERHAARVGKVKVVQLETNRALTEAIALYRATGYKEVAPFNDETYAHHWFEKRL
jgi:DNA-binding MarR family transcriptional regulator/predicted GNAT family N-acyltransferase